MKKILKRIGIGIIMLFLLIQFYPRPEKNNVEGPQPNHISTLYPIPADVDAILKSSCYDCHSNHTDYPWYSHIQPVSWWLGDHIKDAKKKFNFAEFATYSLAKQYHKLEEVTSEVKEGEMPLESYTYIHRDADLTTVQRQLLTAWSENTRKLMSEKYPLDSLVRKKK